MTVICPVCKQVLLEDYAFTEIELQEAISTWWTALICQQTLRHNTVEATLWYFHDKDSEEVHKIYTISKTIANRELDKRDAEGAKRFEELSKVKVK